MFFRKLPNLPEERLKNLLEFERKINIKFKDLNLLNQSLTHSSYTRYNRFSSLLSNERLEFIGDSIISMIISEYLYKKYPNYNEGILSSIKSDVVSRKVMYEIGTQIELDKYILTFPPLNKFNERGKKTIISNCLEALVGAIYLSNGIDISKKFILNLFEPIINDRIKNGTRDYKSILQTFVIEIFEKYPKYSIVEERGPNHNKEFVVKVSVNDITLGEGVGFSKKEAEQSAAKNALDLLKNQTQINKNSSS